jgi:hypothetical protein
MTVHWHASHNVSGSLPDSDEPADSYATWHEARAALLDDLAHEREGYAYAFGIEPGDTRVARLDYSLADAMAQLSRASEDRDFLVYTTDGGQHTLPTAWQIGACASLDCAPPEDDDSQCRRLASCRYPDGHRDGCTPPG